MVKKHFKGTIRFVIFLVMTMLIYSCLSLSVKAFTPTYKLSKFEVNKKSFKNGQTLKISCKVKGENLDPFNSSIVFSGRFGYSGCSNYDPEKGILTFTITIDNEFTPREYKIESIDLQDTIGNRVTIYNSKYYNKKGKNYVDMSGADFKVK